MSDLVHWVRSNASLILFLDYGNVDLSEGRPGLIDHCDDASPPPPPTLPHLLTWSALLSYGDRAGHVGPAISSDFRNDWSELIDHCDDVSPPPSSPLLSSQPSALLSYGDGAGHDGPCAAKSSDFQDDRSQLTYPCADVTSPALLGASCDERCVAVATDFGDRGSGLIDDCDDVLSTPSHPPSTLLSVSLSSGELNDLCNDVSERGDGGRGRLCVCVVF